MSTTPSPITIPKIVEAYVRAQGWLEQPKGIFTFRRSDAGRVFWVNPVDVAGAAVVISEAERRALNQVLRSLVLCDAASVPLRMAHALEEAGRSIDLAETIQTAKSIAQILLKDAGVEAEAFSFVLKAQAVHV